MTPFAWTYEKTNVEYDGRALTVDGRHLPLDRITRLARVFSVSTAQGSWNRLDCQVHLLADGEVASVRFRGDGSSEEWGPWRGCWDQLDALVRGEVEPRLLDRTLSQVGSASRVEIGSLGAKGRGRFVVTADALQARRLFAKPIRWQDITEVTDGVIQIVTVTPDGKRRKHATGLGSWEWDAWQIPLLWQHFARSA